MLKNIWETHTQVLLNQPDEDRLPSNQPGRHLRAINAAVNEIIGLSREQDRKPVTLDEVQAFLGLNPEIDPITDQSELNDKSQREW